MSSDSTEWGPDVISPSGKILQSPYYGYLISESSSYAFTALFGLSMFIHLIQAVCFRQWWLVPTVVLCGIGEALGWGGRIWSFYEPLDQTPYLVQIVALIIAPTPFIGAVFMTFARMAQWSGTKYSRLSPRLYSRIFLTSDIVCLCVQAVGGGIAGSSNDDSTAELGGRIMLAGN
ncbi:hypothetical protein QCA50_015370 [Cerrena zonata]|uniref:RTA1 domain protein n=1 Tax=Cerrena zonata TaxID=2478898 RepID=A0AAW0FLW6_9APHY